jgi:hypothetical protein
MATRRTSDSTRSPKPAAAPPANKPAKAATDAKSASRKPSDAKAADVNVSSAKSAGATRSEISNAGSAPPATPVATPNAAPAKRAAKPKAGKASTPAPRAQVSEDTRRGMIAESAYLRAERRGFAPGHEDEDWVAAEREVDALLNAKTGASSQ